MTRKNVPSEDRASPSLSVVAVNWNTRDLLERCLDSFFSTYRRPAEVIVVENGSSDGSAAMVAERFPQCRLIRNPRNRGYAEANNQGIRASRGDYILLLSSDVFLREGTAEGLLGYLEGHPEFGAAAFRLVNEDGSFQHNYERLEEKWLHNATHYIRKYNGTLSSFSFALIAFMDRLRICLNPGGRT